LIGSSCWKRDADADISSSTILSFIRQSGKQQVRRFGIAPNNRTIYITTNRQGKVLGVVINKSFSETSEGTVKEIDLSRVVRIQLGQQSRRFAKVR